MLFTKAIRRVLVNYHRGLDILLFYCLLLALIGAAVYLFMPVGVHRIFNRFAPPIVAFCLMVQTLLGHEGPGVIRPVLRHLVWPGDEVIYRWHEAGEGPGQPSELRFGQVQAIRRNVAPPDNYARALRGTRRTDLAVIQIGAAEVEVPLILVMLR